MANYLPFPQGFEVLHDGPIDNRDTVETLEDLNNFLAAVRYEGMRVYVKEIKEVYILKGGILNSNWQKFAPTPDGGDGGEIDASFETDKTIPTLVEVGGISKGTSVAELAGKTLSNVIELMLWKPSPAPNFSQPKVTLSPNSQTVEEGTELTITFDSTYTKNDAGNQVGAARLMYNGSHQDVLPNEFTFNVFGRNEFQAEVDHQEGTTTKTTEDGVEWPNTIQADTITSSKIVFQGQRAMFYGAVDSEPAISDDIRSLLKIISGKSTKKLDILSSNAGKYFVFAYPSTYGKLSFVKYIEGLGANVLGTFKNMQIDVADASLGNEIEYEVYVTTSPLLFSSTVQYEFQF